MTAVEALSYVKFDLHSSTFTTNNQQPTINYNHNQLNDDYNLY